MSEGLGGLAVVAVGGWCCGGSGYLVEMLRRAFRQVRRPVSRVARSLEEGKRKKKLTIHEAEIFWIADPPDSTTERPVDCSDFSASEFCWRILERF